MRNNESLLSWRGIADIFKSIEVFSTPKTVSFPGLSKCNRWFILPILSYHLSFNLGYPNNYDRAHKRTGSALMVHGNCVSIGCYAMTDDGINEIYALSDAALRNGQSFFRVHIFPFKMGTKNMKKHKEAKWYSFWVNLKEGYDFFENNDKTPPNVEVKNGVYLFSKS